MMAMTAMRMLLLLLFKTTAYLVHYDDDDDDGVDLILPFQLVPLEFPLEWQQQVWDLLVLNRLHCVVW